MNLRKLFERKQPHISARLNGQGPAWIVPIDGIQEIVDEAHNLAEQGNDDQFACEIVMMRPSDVAEFPEFDGF